MGDANRVHHSDPEQLRRFMKCLLQDLRALEQMIADGMIESDKRRIGAEQELFLTDSALRPAARNAEVLKQLNGPQFKPELARFNIEFDYGPLDFKGDCLSRLELGFHDLTLRVRDVAEQNGMEVILIGTLPTMVNSDLHTGNMTPEPRYIALNDALSRQRGESFEFRVQGIDELIVNHDSVMLEACNTSCQVHLQVDPDSFAHFYNVSQCVTAPVLAVAVNSPLLFGRRLWSETRIAIFQQAVDTRSPGHHVQQRCARVSFGDGWVRSSALEIFQEDVARFRVVLGIDVDEDPFDAIRQGRAPRLQALQMHNSTVYRWNRPCYGVFNGKPHLRIENRAFPSGPTLLDEVANAAFWLGLVNGLAEQVDDVRHQIAFDAAKANFQAAARFGLDAQFVWIDGKSRPARELILGELLALAQSGLESAKIDAADIQRYLGVIEGRASSGKTGAHWQLDSLAAMAGAGTREQRHRALVAGTLSRQKQNRPVHEWTLATLSESGGWWENYHRVDQCMTTDLFTVHADEVIDLVANLMDWRHIRHVPVEDDEHRLVGLVSYRSLLRFLAKDIPHGRDHPVPVRSIMHPDPITVAPETSTAEAISLMQRERVACLPVVKEGQLVGIVTERDFVDLAARMFEAYFKPPAGP